MDEGSEFGTFESVFLLKVPILFWLLQIVYINAILFDIANMKIKPLKEKETAFWFALRQRVLEESLIVLVGEG